MALDGEEQVQAENLAADREMEIAMQDFPALKDLDAALSEMPAPPICGFEAVWSKLEAMEAEQEMQKEPNLDSYFKAFHSALSPPEQQYIERLGNCLMSQDDKLKDQDPILVGMKASVKLTPKQEVKAEKSAPDLEGQYLESAQAMDATDKTPLIAEENKPKLTLLQKMGKEIKKVWRKFRSMFKRKQKSADLTFDNPLAKKEEFQGIVNPMFDGGSQKREDTPGHYEEVPGAAPSKEEQARMQKDGNYLDVAPTKEPEYLEIKPAARKERPQTFVEKLEARKAAASLDQKAGQTK